MRFSLSGFRSARSRAALRGRASEARPSGRRSTTSRARSAGWRAGSSEDLEDAARVVARLACEHGRANALLVRLADQIVQRGAGLGQLGVEPAPVLGRVEERA